MSELKDKHDLARHIRSKKTQDVAKQLTSDLAELCNVMGSDHKEAVINGITEGLTKQHRFIQQEFISALQTALSRYGETGSDGRNVGAIAWAKEAGNIPSRR